MLKLCIKGLPLALRIVFGAFYQTLSYSEFLFPPISIIFCLCTLRSVFFVSHSSCEWIPNPSLWLLSFSCVLIIYRKKFLKYLALPLGLGGSMEFRVIAIKVKISVVKQLLVEQPLNLLSCQSPVFFLPTIPSTEGMQNKC